MSMPRAKNNPGLLSDNYQMTSLVNPFTTAGRKSMANSAYENFRDNNTASLSTNIRTPYSSLNRNFPAYPNPQPTLSPALKGQISGLKSLAAKAADQALPGLGGYLNPKLTAAGLIFNGHGRINELLKQNTNKSTSVLCGALGAVVEEGASKAGKAIVVAASAEVLINSGGTALLPVSAMAVAGFNAVGSGSKALGDLAQTGCVKVMDQDSSSRTAIPEPSVSHFKHPQFLSKTPQSNFYKNVTVKESRVKQVSHFNVSNKSETNANGDLIGMVFYDHKGEKEIKANSDTIKEGYIVFCSPESLKDDTRTFHSQLFERVLGNQTAIESTTVSGFSRQNGVWKKNSWTLNDNTGENYISLRETTFPPNQMSDYEFDIVKKAAENYLKTNSQGTLPSSSHAPYFTANVHANLSIQQNLNTPMRRKF